MQVQQLQVQVQGSVATTILDWRNLVVSLARGVFALLKNGFIESFGNQRNLRCYITIPLWLGLSLGQTLGWCKLLLVRNAPSFGLLMHFF